MWIINIIVAIGLIIFGVFIGIELCAWALSDVFPIINFQHGNKRKNR